MRSIFVFFVCLRSVFGNHFYYRLRLALNTEIMDCVAKRFAASNGFTQKAISAITIQPGVICNQPNTNEDPAEAEESNKKRELKGNKRLP